MPTGLPRSLKTGNIWLGREPGLLAGPCPGPSLLWHLPSAALPLGRAEGRSWCMEHVWFPVWAPVHPEFEFFPSVPFLSKNVSVLRGTQRKAGTHFSGFTLQTHMERPGLGQASTKTVWLGLPRWGQEPRHWLSPLPPWVQSGQLELLALPRCYLSCRWANDQPPIPLLL